MRHNVLYTCARLDYTRHNVLYTHVIKPYAHDIVLYMRVKTPYTHVIKPYTHVIKPYARVMNDVMRVKNVVAHDKSPRVPRIRNDNLTDNPHNPQKMEVSAHVKEPDKAHRPFRPSIRP
jgi:hypothetical protein